MAISNSTTKVKRFGLAREFSYDAFTSVLDGQYHADEVGQILYSRYKISFSRADSAFLKEILYGGLRWYGKLLWILQKTSKRNLNEISPVSRTALVLGAYQIFYMDNVPDRIAVNESVEYVRKKGEGSAVPYINGVLRSIARRAEYFTKPDKDKYPVAYLALQYSHPNWIVDRWLQRFSFEKTRAILLANNQVPPCTIRINPLAKEFDGVLLFQKKILRYEKYKSTKQHLPYCLSLKNYSLFTKDSFFGKGFFTLQDEGSQLVGHLVNPAVKDEILVVCIGAGEKIGQLYEASMGKSNVFGIDSSERRIEQARCALSRLGHQSIELLQGDFLDTSLFTNRRFNKILLEAPSSGLGGLRRHPEGKWREKASVIISCARRQRSMLDRAFSLLREGGEIIYSVGSFETEESAAHVNYLLKKYPQEIERVSLRSRVHDYYRRLINRDGILQVRPGSRENMDGFGAFIVRKKKCG